MTRSSIIRLAVVASLAVAPAVVPAPASAQEVEDSCRSCHEMLQGRLGTPVELFAQDVHEAAGFGCSACHGGDPTIQGAGAMDEAKGYIGAPGPQQIPEVCGRCHSNAGFMRQYNPSLRVDQVTEYVTSVHGQRLLSAGDENVATCASCHGTHGILSASDSRSRVHPLRVADTCGECHADAERMEGYGIPFDQLQKYKSSIHWATMSETGDLSAPTCNDCHGNHGASPPGVDWVGNVCGQCHVVMHDYFNESRHSEAFKMMGVPGCALCHQNHAVVAASDEMLGVHEGAVCARCHREGDPGGTVAEGMGVGISGLRSSLDSARHILESAENSGMEVSEALASLNDGQSALIKARAAVHAFDLETVEGEIEPGIEVAEAALARGERALRDLQTRRLGLGISVLIIGALIVGLVFKIRDVERVG